MKNLFTTALWLTTAAVTVVLLIGGAMMDGPDDIQAAQDAADSEKALARAYASAQADGGHSLCAKFGRVPMWTADGHLICRERPSATAVAGGAK